MLSHPNTRESRTSYKNAYKWKQRRHKLGVVRNIDGKGTRKAITITIINPNVKTISRNGDSDGDVYVVGDIDRKINRKI